MSSGLFIPMVLDATPASAPRLARLEAALDCCCCGGITSVRAVKTGVIERLAITAKRAEANVSPMIKDFC